MRYPFLLFLASIVLCISDAEAATSARELQAYCEKASHILKNGPEKISSHEDMLQVGRCMGMVEATLFLFVADWKEAGCKTTSINFMQGAEVFLAYMQDGSGSSEKPAVQEVYMALASSLPCQKIE